MSALLRLGCVFLVLIIATIKADVVILNVKNNALVAVFKGIINLENLTDLQLQISKLEENLKRGASDGKLENTSPTNKEENTICTRQLVQYLKISPDVMKAFTTEFLIKFFKADYNDGIMDVNSLTAELYEFPAKVFGEIIKAVLKETYNKVQHEQILAFIVSAKHIPQSIAGMNELFGKIKNSGDLNNNILINLASDLSILQNQTEFASLSSHMKYIFNKMVDSLPVCARNLFFKPEVCLWGVIKRNFEDAEAGFLGPFSASMEKNSILFESLKERDNYLFASHTYHNDSGIWKRTYTGCAKHSSINQRLWKVELDGDYCYLENVYYKGYFLFANGFGFVAPQKEDSSLWQPRFCPED